MIVGIILAAGKGKRFKSREPKCFIKLKGKKILEYSLNKLAKYVDILVVAVPPKRKDIFKETEDMLRELEGEARKKNKNLKTLVVYGGKERFESFLKAFRKIQQNFELKDGDIILEHDGARPLFSEKLLKKVISYAEKYGSAVPFITPPETIRLIKGRKEPFSFSSEIPRKRVALIQTPQAFSASLIKKALEKNKNKIKNKSKITDLAGLIFKTSKKIKGIKGERENIKITFPVDIKISSAILSEDL
ncbi:Ribitol-5-phosphate cytidylyltransferase [bacterium HR19]|nr:Ribitol-5-phosphate cytidylyltransferase [bacterium HR19]